MKIGRDVDFTQLVLPKSATAAAESLREAQPFSVKSVDTEKRQITAVASSEIIDRSGDIVLISAIKKAVKAFMRNPVILVSHAHRLDDGRSPVVGKVIAYEFKGKDFLITVEFAPTDLGLEYWKLYRDKYQRAFSIAFRVLSTPKSEKRDGKTVYIFTDIELLEISVCAIPMNPAALSKSKSFVQQKQFDREKQAIMNDDNAFCELMDRFEKLQYEYGDMFGNVPVDSALWDKFTPAEAAILKELEANSEAFVAYEEECRQDGLYDEIDDGSDAEDGEDFKALELKPAALSLAAAMRKRDKVFIEAFGSEALYRKYKLYLETKEGGINPASLAGPGRKYTHEEFKLFELITEKGLSAATESIASGASLDPNAKSFAELVGGKK